MHSPRTLSRDSKQSTCLRWNTSHGGKWPMTLHCWRSSLWLRQAILKGPAGDLQTRSVRKESPRLLALAHLMLSTSSWAGGSSFFTEFFLRSYILRSCTHPCQEIYEGQYVCNNIIYRSMKILQTVFKLKFYSLNKNCIQGVHKWGVRLKSAEYLLQIVQGFSALACSIRAAFWRMKTC